MKPLRIIASLILWLAVAIELFIAQDRVTVSAYNSNEPGYFICDYQDDNIEINKAFYLADSLNKDVTLLPGDYRIGKTQSDRILKLEDVSLYGYGARITIPDSCNNNAPTVIECQGGEHNYTGIFGITIYGNYQGQQSFTIVNGFPAGGSGIATMQSDFTPDSTLYEFDYDGNILNKVFAENIIIKDVEVINTIRNNLLLPGSGHFITDFKGSVSWKDHNIYISSGRDLVFNNIFLDTIANAAICIRKASLSISNINPGNIIFNNITSNCNYKAEGYRDFILIIGDKEDIIKNIIINNLTIKPNIRIINSVNTINVLKI